MLKAALAESCLSVFRKGNKMQNARVPCKDRLYIEHKYIYNNACTNYTFKATCSCFFVGISSYTA